MYNKKYALVYRLIFSYSFILTHTLYLFNSTYYKLQVFFIAAYSTFFSTEKLQDVKESLLIYKDSAISYSVFHKQHHYFSVTNFYIWNLGFLDSFNILIVLNTIIDHKTELLSLDIAKSLKYSVVSSWNYRIFDNIKFFYKQLNTFSIFKFFNTRYGIGFYTSKMLCFHLGVHPKLVYQSINLNHYYSRTRFFFLNNLQLLDKNISMYILSRQLRLIRLNTYKGLRLIHGKPSNGQRTRSNGNSAAKMPYALSFKIHV